MAAFAVSGGCVGLARAGRREARGEPGWRATVGEATRYGMKGDSPLLSLVLPKGSLERATLDLFAAADLTVRRSSDRDYHAPVDDPRIDRGRFLRPQELPSYIEQGLVAFRITGRVWLGA